MFAPPCECLRSIEAIETHNDYIISKVAYSVFGRRVEFRVVTVFIHLPSGGTLVTTSSLSHLTPQDRLQTFQGELSCFGWLISSTPYGNCSQIEYVVDINFHITPLKVNNYVEDEIIRSIHKNVNNLRDNPYALHPQLKLARAVLEEKEQFSVHAQQAVESLCQLHKDSSPNDWTTFFQRDGIEIQEFCNPSQRGLMRCKSSIQVQ